MDGANKGMEEVLAESLAALEQGEGLEAVLARYPGEANELRPLLEMAAWMGAERAAVEPRAGFVRASRARLVGRIAELGAAPQLSWWERLGLWWSSGNRRTALQLAVVVVMLACLVLGSSGMAYASQGSLPGDALYPVKLGVEQAQLWANLDPVEEVRLHMRFSQERVEEIEELVKLGRYQDVHQAMLDYEYHIDQATQQVSRLALKNPEGAGRLALEIEKFLADHSVLLNTLIALVPSETASDFVRAISVTIVGDRTLQVIIVQTGVEPTLVPTLVPTLPIGGHPTATDTLAPSATLTQQPSGTPTPTPTLPATLSPTVEAGTSTPTRTLVPTATLRITSPTPTVGPVIIQPTIVPPEPTATPEPTDRPHPNPTRRPPKPDDKNDKKSSKK